MSRGATANHVLCNNFGNNSISSFESMIWPWSSFHFKSIHQYKCERRRSCRRKNKSWSNIMIQQKSTHSNCYICRFVSDITINCFNLFSRCHAETENIEQEKKKMCVYAYERECYTHWIWERLMTLFSPICPDTFVLRWQQQKKWNIFSWACINRD